MKQDPDSHPADENRTNRRALLMQTAESLFAERGIDAVSLNEINKAANQRNTSAMHYHFGNKQGLVDAIIYSHYAAIDKEINARLDAYEEGPAALKTPRNLLRAVVTPFADQLDTPKGVNYLLIVRQVLMQSSDMLLKGHAGGEDTARLRVFRLFQGVTSALPRSVRPARLVLSAGLIFNSLATSAQSGMEGQEIPLGSKALFVSNLLDALEILFTSQPSEETLKIISREYSAGA